MRFTGKPAIVTGSGQGIGEAYAKALAADGVAWWSPTSTPTGAERVSGRSPEPAARPSPSRLTCRTRPARQEMADAALAAFGRIDYLVNNVVIYGDMAMQPLMTVDADYYHRFMEVNVNGARRGARGHVCRRSPTEGAIVNQSSVASWLPSGFYSMSKAGVNALTVSLATELTRKNIRLNAIAPGFIDTEATRKITPEKMLAGMTMQTPMRRLGTPAELCGLVLFMLSDEAGYMNGQIVAVDGGLITRVTAVERRVDDSAHPASSDGVR